ncbi:hypothetical protein HHK36_008951 [Tetracentron sinense]|uniref:L-ascorbate peroxidase n=1 Tax=Tetracentron sinense TaxID=13715 RepID=A0A835DL77_TETSI|nr:hypothetical protein HHK36_008951 [Tetracentron sinense]
MWSRNVSYPFHVITLKTKATVVRLGWHDAGTYDKNIEEWPQRGGANGSLRFEIELKHAANAGLVNALKLLQPIKDKYSAVTYADLFQLASATAVEVAGGPKIPMKYGRVDISEPDQCPEEGKLPDAGPPSPAGHLRDVFYRMGLSDKEIVALSGAHTLGRSRPERSGWGKPETKYTKDGPGTPGGQSWTVQWLKFDNSYFTDIKERRDEDLLVLPTDAALFEDPSFKVYAEKYAEDQDAFFKDYAEAHAKLSNQGAKFDPPQCFSHILLPLHKALRRLLCVSYFDTRRSRPWGLNEKKIRIIWSSLLVSMRMGNESFVPYFDQVGWFSRRDFLHSSPVPFQYGKDMVIESHGTAFEVNKGEMLFGFQPFAKKDPKGFSIDDGPANNAPEKFVASKYSSGKVVIMENLCLETRILFCCAVVLITQDEAIFQHCELIPKT